MTASDLPEHIRHVDCSKFVQSVTWQLLLEML